MHKSSLPDPPEGYQWRKCLYIGRALQRKTYKIHYKWIYFDVDFVSELDESAYFTFSGRKNITRAAPGNLYWVCEGETSVKLDETYKPRFIERLKGSQVVQWELADKATKSILDMRRREKKSHYEQPLHELLHPVKMAYEKARTADERRAILTEVMRVICEGRF